MHRQHMFCYGVCGQEVQARYPETGAPASGSFCRSDRLLCPVEAGTDRGD